MVAKKVDSGPIVVRPPKLRTAEFMLRSTAPYVQNKFSNREREKIKKKQESGSQGTKGQKKEPKDFQRCYEESIHRTADGKLGIPAPAFRNAMITACTLCGIFMTRARMTVFVEPDGFDCDDGTPLVFFSEGEPRYTELTVRQQMTVDIRCRPMWDTWACKLRVTFDEDQFSLEDVANLLVRAGVQVGIGEGRPASKTSGGMGWGTFRIEGSA